MSKYQNIKAISFAALAVLVILGLLLISAIVMGSDAMAFFAICGVVFAFTSICCVDSILADHRRIYSHKKRVTRREIAPLY